MTPAQRREMIRRAHELYHPCWCGIHVCGDKDGAAATFGNVPARSEADAHLTCSYPDCKCKQLPTAIRAALSQLRTQVEGLEAALKPFAKLFDRIEEGRTKFGPAHWPDNETEYVVTLPEGGRQPDLTFGDLRRARSALSASPAPSLQDERERAEQRSHD
jgi:hypothetical protein